jgi:hypothetical protein
VVEPQRATTITVNLALPDAGAAGLTSCSLTAADHLGAAAPDSVYDGIPGVSSRAAFQVAGARATPVSATAHAFAAFAFPQPSTYAVAVRCTFDDGSVEVVEAEVACVYVRREIRRMSDLDRNEYLNAIRTMADTPSETGQNTYGANFNR